MATFTEPVPGRRFDRATHARLIQQSKAVVSTEQAWLYLEAAGQLLRLWLVPVGHLSGRLVIRYAPLHQGSDQAVKLQESARSQGKYLAVLEAVLGAQPSWADHGRPDIEVAFKVAEQAGLDLAKARQDIAQPGMQALLQQDIDDLTALQVKKTPTFFVNGRSLPSFGPDQLAALVAEEVAKARR